MDQIISSRLDLHSDIDLESGGTTSEEDARIAQAQIHKNPKKNSKLMSRESSYEYTDASDFAKYENLPSLGSKSKKMQLMKFREGMGSLFDDKKRVVKKHTAARPPRPYRPLKGQLLDVYDVKLIKEIYELNSKRRRMGRIRNFGKMKKQKGSSVGSKVLAFIVTVIFFVVIILQGLLGSRV